MLTALQLGIEPGNALAPALAPVDQASLAVARQILEIMFPAANRAEQFAAPDARDFGAVARYGNVENL